MVKTWRRRRRRKALAEKGGEESVSAVSDYPMSGIQNLGKPTIAVVADPIVVSE